MKKLSTLLLMISMSFISIQAQIFVGNDGSIYDQREQQTPQSHKKVEKPKATGKSFDKSKLEFGGDLGLQFGSYTLVNISPQVGYRVSKIASLGAGLGYTYYKDSRGTNDYRRSYGSFNLYGRLYPVNFLVFSIQPEVSRMWETEKYGGQTYKNEKFVPSFLVGGGLRIGNLMAQIHYDVVQDNNSPYGNNIFYSLGYTFSF